ncbi:MAG: hypothetical protein H7246_14990 [Phycisphaerae bacterium]|nr:hypothetical protein [Saprospiraceae bacterium]
MPTVKITCHTGNGRMSPEGYDSLVFHAVYLNDNGSEIPFDSSMGTYRLNVWVNGQFWGTSGRPGLQGNYTVFTTHKNEGAPYAKPGQSLDYEIVQETANGSVPTMYTVDSDSHWELSTSMSY